MLPVRCFRRTLIAALWLAALGAGIAASVQAQSYVTARPVYLRRSPSMKGAKLRELAQGDTVTRRPSVAARLGWLPVRTPDGKAGWVGIVNLRDVAAAVASAATTTTPDSSSQAAPRIDASWPKPSIDTSTILVQAGAKTCGPHGDDTSDDGTNYHKNRVDVPTLSHLITLEAIRSLPDTALWRFTNRKHWTAEDSALVLPYEGIPVTVEGYFEIVKPQATAAPTGNNQVGESPNCHSWSEDDTDWHMALVADASETEERAVVVEPTPRTKRNHAAWGLTNVEKLAVRMSPSSPRNEAGATRVRVTGFLMLDPVHPTHIRGHCTANCASKHFYRATLWEVHPVTRIEVLRSGAWVPLDSSP